jgi:hypothetical protein
MGTHSWRAKIVGSIVVLAALTAPGSAWAGYWKAPVSMDSTALTGVSCATTSFCIAIDQNAYVFKGNGVTWSPGIRLRTPEYAHYSVSCPTTSFCAVVGSNGWADTLKNNAWGVASHIGLDATAVSCSSSSFCIAVGDGGSSLVYNGSSWGPSGLWDDASNIETGVSCTSSSFCRVVDNGGNVFTWDGSSWSGALQAPVLNSISCVGSSFCMTVGEAVEGDAGYSYSWNGATWTYDGTAPFYSPYPVVSCTSSSFCLAADGTGDTSVWNGSDWSPDYNPAGEGYSAVSCVNPSFCVVVDAAGGEVTWV